jgi:hypothetical protein
MRLDIKISVHGISVSVCAVKLAQILESSALRFFFAVSEYFIDTRLDIE